MSLNNSVVARGWIEGFLKTQMDGLTGHIEECGYPFDRPWWGTEKKNAHGENDEGVKSSWWTYEQVAYWLDGYLRLAILLDDGAAVERVRDIIYSVIDNADSDGYLGPQFLKKTGGWNRWPHVVFFRACMAYYEHTKDSRVLSAMTRHYLESPCDYSLFRDVNNVEIMLFLYEKTGESALLELAERSYAEYNKKAEADVRDEVALSDKQPYIHGVTYCEYSKLGAILYRYTGKESYLRSSVSAMDKAERMFMLPGGCICSDEFMISDHYTESYETCLFSDFPWALYALARATGQGRYYDLAERCIYNAALGSVTEDFRALQYFSCANQVIADATSNHNHFFRGSKWMSYRPNPGTECCPGNVNRFMPNFVRHMWEGTADVVRCNMYGASVYRNGSIEITEKTNYPFEESVSFDIKTERAFEFKFRIPRWVKGVRVRIDGAEQKLPIADGYASVGIDGGCSVAVEFDTEIEKISTYNGVYFRKGVLVYSLGGKERREIDEGEERSSKDFPAYNMYPEFEWRYGIDRFAEPEFVSGRGDYYSERDELPSILVKAAYLPEWDYVRQESVQRCTNLYKKTVKDMDIPVTFTPPIPENISNVGESRVIRLYPYGCCKLRITVFPQLNQGG